jgi:protein-L-isoaspartate(D-aspartate) O-methyltransferase
MGSTDHRSLETEGATGTRLRDMVEYQLRARGIADERVLRAMATVPRHLFVPDTERDVAYADGPLPIGFGQTISQPYIVALMLEALELRGYETVLEVGAGSGYQAALLGRLVRKVYAVEIVPELADSASRALAGFGASNVEVVVGDGSVGLLEHAPYDAIVVAAGAPSVPEPLVEQLMVGGRLVVPVGSQFSQRLLRVRRLETGTAVDNLGWCVFVPLRGDAGWDRRRARVKQLIEAKRVCNSAETVLAQPGLALPDEERERIRAALGETRAAIIAGEPRLARDRAVVLRKLLDRETRRRPSRWRKHRR